MYLNRMGPLGGVFPNGIQTRDLRLLVGPGVSETAITCLTVRQLLLAWCTRADKFTWAIFRGGQTKKSKLYPGLPVLAATNEVYGLGLPVLQPIYRGVIVAKGGQIFK